MSHETPATNNNDGLEVDSGNYDFSVAAQEQSLYRQLKDTDESRDSVIGEHGTLKVRVNEDGELNIKNSTQNNSRTVLRQSNAPEGLTESKEITVQELYDGRVDDVAKAEKAAKDHYQENEDQVIENARIEYDAHKKAEEKLKEDGKVFAATEDVKEAKFQADQAELTRVKREEELREISTESKKAIEEARSALEEAEAVGSAADEELSKLVA